MAKRFIEAIRILITREPLGREDPPPGDPRPSFAGWLFQPDRLPPPAVPVPPPKTSFFRWLVVPDKLPAPGAGEGEGRKSLLTELLAKEALPLDPPPIREKKAFGRKKGKKRNPANKSYR